MKKILLSQAGRYSALSLLALALLGSNPRIASAATLYDDLGGQAKLSQVASDTIDNALADDRIKAAFEDVNIPRLKKMLYQQFCQVTDGGCIYKGSNMQKAHAGLHLHESDFNALVENLEKAMDKNDIPYAVQTRFIARLAPMEPQVVSK